MSEYVFKMPDLGEGTVEAEIVAWHVKPGDAVSEDKVIVEVMTDKAAVEVPSPVSGRIVSLRGEPGDKIAVGAPLIVFDTGGAAGAAGAASAPATTTTASAAATPASPVGTAPATNSVTPTSSGRAAPAPAAAGRSGAATRVMASPATRRRAREAGIDLGSIAGSGPGGRILKDDLQAATAPARRDAAVPSAPTPTPSVAGAAGATTEIKIIGVRRVIAERMSEAKRNIPHFAYVEEVDVTELESLRQHLNAKAGERGSLTYLPFIVTALVRV
ncbi:MAG: 2-oxo acid dehydrogenase subunit E2, partial [Proteobacteria bacterium]|nr:2-oxo acid dehydrogenase subunit E2 [Pseudomonadota bacterium]